MEVVADIMVDSDVERLLQATIAQLGRLDILVNNAGVSMMTTIEHPQAMAHYETIMNTNVRGVYFLTHLAVPHLIQSKGNIINISSIAGLSPVCWKN